VTQTWTDRGITVGTITPTGNRSEASWSLITLQYFYEEGQKGSPFLIRDLKPIQMPNMDLEELFQARRAFTEGQWIDALLRSTGMGPTNFQERVKWHLLARMIPP
jgi:ATP-dependent Lon protease